jgi:Flp pilus assembly secretin CpaC
MLSDGQAVVIGGLIKETNIDSQNKIPFLGDLWVVGRLFQSRERQKERNEIIITLLPRIAAASDSCWIQNDDNDDLEQARSPLMDNSLVPQDRPWEGQLKDASMRPTRAWPWSPRATKSTTISPTNVAPANKSQLGAPPVVISTTPEIGSMTPQIPFPANSFPADSQFINQNVIPLPQNALPTVPDFTGR